MIGIMTTLLLALALVLLVGAAHLFQIVMYFRMNGYSIDVANLRRRHRNVIAMLIMTVLVISASTVHMLRNEASSVQQTIHQISSRSNRPATGIQLEREVHRFWTIWPPHEHVPIFLEDGPASATAREVEDEIGGSVDTRQVSVTSIDIRSGFWSSTSHRRLVTVGVEGLERTPEAIIPWRDELLRELEQLLTAHHDEWWIKNKSLFRQISDEPPPTTGVVTSEVLLGGYAINGITILAVAAFPIFLFKWIRLIVTFVRMSHRFPQNLCPHCGYNLQGCDRDGCPECGWNRPAERNAAPVHDR